MEKEYQKPEVEVVELVTEEITANDYVNGQIGITSNNYFD